MSAGFNFSPNSGGNAHRAKGDIKTDHIQLKAHMKQTDLPSYTKETVQRARELRKNQTPTEWAVWNNLRDKKTGVKFRRQVPIGKYIVDFFSLEIGLVIEIDGSQHYEEKNISYDNRRTAFFKRYRIRIIRFNNHDVATNLDGIIEAVIKKVNELKNEPGFSSPIAGKVA